MAVTEDSARGYALVVLSCEVLLTCQKISVALLMPQAMIKNFIAELGRHALQHTFGREVATCHDVAFMRSTLHCHIAWACRQGARSRGA